MRRVCIEQSRQKGMILLPALILAATIASIAGIASLSRQAGLADAQLQLAKTRALYHAYGGVSHALANVVGLEQGVLPDGQLYSFAYEHGQAQCLILDTASLLDVNRAGEEQLRQAFANAGLEKPWELARELVRSRMQEKRRWPLRSLDMLLQLPSVSPEVFWGGDGTGGLAGNRNKAVSSVARGIVSLLAVHGGVADLRQARQQTRHQALKARDGFASGRSYRILSRGSSSGASVLLWVTVRKEPGHGAGYLVLQRRVVS